MRVTAFANVDEIVKGPVLFEPFTETFQREGKKPITRIQVYGPISGSDLDWWGGLSTNCIAGSILKAANAGSDVELVFDTGGGSVVGLDEVCQAIAKAQETVEVSGYIRGMACSAGIWIASQCHPLRSSPLGVTGSIGVQLVERLENVDGEPTRYRVFRSTGSERKNADPNTDPEQYQSLVDEASANFVRALANGRGIAQNDVLERFGNGSLLTASEALNAGLIDEIVDPAGSVDMKRKAETMPVEEKLPEEALPVETPAEEPAVKPEETPVEDAGCKPGELKGEDAPVEDAPKTAEELLKEIEELRKMTEEQAAKLKEYEAKEEAAKASAHTSARAAAVEAALKAGKITPAMKAHAEKLYDLQAKGEHGIFDALVAGKAVAYPTQRQAAPAKAASKIAQGDSKSVLEAAKTLAAERKVKLSDALRLVVENKA